MKVLLINPHTDSEATAGRYRRFLSPMPPISLAYVAAALDCAGIDVSVYDDYTAGGSRKMLLANIEAVKPDIIGLSCVTPTAARTYEIAEDLRREVPDVKIVMGNLHPSVYYREIISKGLADAVVIGEGEITFVELVKAWEDGASPAVVKGIAYSENGVVAVTPPRPFVEDLDSLPYPAWRFFPIERYCMFNFARVRKPATLVLGSRGCPYGCNFCSLKIMGRRRRRRSARNIADEFEFMNSEFGYRQMSFIDPIFPFSEAEALEFSEELIRRGLHKKVTWITETRVDLVNKRMLSAMKEAGLSRIMYGFETGTEEGLESIDKSFTVEQTRKAVADTRKAGIQIIGFFMIGVPDDTVSSIENTIRFAKSLDIDFAKFTVFSPFPGTKIHDEMKEKGIIPDNPKWEQFTNYPTRIKPPIFLPEGVTNEDIIRLQKKAFVSFYLRPRTILKHLFHIRAIGIKDILSGIITLFSNS